MFFLGKSYFIKMVTKPSDIWNCIKNAFPDKKYKESLPSEMPDHFCLISEGGDFYWDCPPGNDGVVEFKFNGILAEKKISLWIIFNKKEQDSPEKDNKIHLLAYREKTEGRLFFWRCFFQKLKNHIPKKYTKVDVIYEQYRGPKTLPKDILRDEKDELEKTCIRFLPDEENKKIFVSDEWIEKLQEDLWPFNVKFLKSGNIRFFLEEKAQQERIIVEVSKESIYETDEIRKKGEEGYEALLNAIIDRLGSSFSPYEAWLLNILNINNADELFDNRVKGNFPDLVKTEECKRVQEQVVLYIKEKGLDEIQIQKDRELIKELEEENASLKSKLEESSLSERNTANEKQPMNYVVDSANLNNEVKDEERVKQLTDENANLKNEIENLKNENDKLEKKYEGILNSYEGLQKKNTKKQNEENSCIHHLEIPCSEENLFENEIEDYLYMLLYSKIDEEKQNLPTNKEDERWRKRDVLEKLIDEKDFKEEETESYKKRIWIENILNNSKKLTKEQIRDLKAEGLKQVGKTSDHLKLCFFDKRYQTSFSTTKIDERAGKNKCKDIERSFFLILGSKK